MSDNFRCTQIDTLQRNRALGWPIQHAHDADTPSVCNKRSWCSFIYQGPCMFRIRSSVGRLGRNQKADVQSIQNLLNANLAALTPLQAVRTDGVVDDAVIAAIEQYQRSVERAASPSGLIEPNGFTLKLLCSVLGTFPKGGLAAPEWLRIASKEEGVTERAGLASNNPRILEYLNSVAGLADIKYIQKRHGTAIVTDYKMNAVDETAWCACFVNWCLRQAGKKGMQSAQAKAWARHGSASAARPGAICVIYRKPFSDSASGWHVGFWIGGPPQAPILLGGNQNNSVCRKQFLGIEQVYYRWPQ
jgi:uncharacterized protein (TIGR02594 family)